MNIIFDTIYIKLNNSIDIIQLPLNMTIFDFIYLDYLVDIHNIYLMVVLVITDFSSFV